MRGEETRIIRNFAPHSFYINAELCRINILLSHTHPAIPFFVTVAFHGGSQVLSSSPFLFWWHWELAPVLNKAPLLRAYPLWCARCFCPSSTTPSFSPCPSVYIVCGKANTRQRWKQKSQSHPKPSKYKRQKSNLSRNLRTDKLKNQLLKFLLPLSLIRSITKVVANPSSSNKRKSGWQRFPAS